jgi:hypothetical protein
MNPVSFSDDAPGLSFGRRHALRVQADVAPAPDLSWVQGFRSRLLLKPEQELKSQAVIAALPTLPEHERRMFFASIQSFRVHVTDPQPYELEAQDILLGAIPKKTLSVIGQMANQQPGTPETARLRLLLRIADGHVRRRVIRNTASRNLASRLRFFSRVLSVSPLGPDLQDDVADDWPEDHMVDTSSGHRAGVAKAVKAASKIATVFSRADDEVERTLDAAPDLLLGLRIAARRSVAKIGDEFAFDEGDSESTQRTREERDNYEAALWSGFGDVRSHAPRGELIELRSDRFVELQAADVAVGWARKVLSENGLGSLRSYFDYITFNGERLTGENLQDVQGRAGYIILP